MLKKILAVIGIAILLLFGAWFFFINKTGSPPLDEPVLPGSPFGSGDSAGIPASLRIFEGEVEPLPEAESANDTRLFKLSSAPVAGFTILTRSTSTRATTTIVVRYADRATGHIFDLTLPREGGELQKTRITNNTLPQIYEAYFRPDGNAVLMRALESDTGSVRNMALSLSAPRGTSTDGLYGVSLALLRGSLDSVSVGANNTLLYMLQDSGAIVSSAFNGDGVRTISNTAFRGWRTGRFGSNILLFTKPSASLPGYAYRLTPQGNLVKLLGPLNGLIATANQSGNRLLYSYADNGVTRLFARDMDRSTVSEVVPATLAEKCVWSVRQAAVFFCGVPLGNLFGEEPDNWYRGATHFSDYLWRFDSVSEAASLIVEPKSEFGLDLDIFMPVLSADERYLIFINKTDLTLWAVRLS